MKENKPNYSLICSGSLTAIKGTSPKQDAIFSRSTSNLVQISQNRALDLFYLGSTAHFWVQYNGKLHNKKSREKQKWICNLDNYNNGS